MTSADIFFIILQVRLITISIYTPLDTAGEMLLNHYTQYKQYLKYTLTCYPAGLLGSLVLLILFFALPHTKWRTRRRGKATIPTGYVINHHSGGWVADVTGDEAAETLLSGCIPELQPDLWPATKQMWEHGGNSWSSQGMEGKQNLEIMMGTKNTITCSTKWVKKQNKKLG